MYVVALRKNYFYGFHARKGLPVDMPCMRHSHTFIGTYHLSSHADIYADLITIVSGPCPVTCFPTFFSDAEGGLLLSGESCGITGRIACGYCGRHGGGGQGSSVIVLADTHIVVLAVGAGISSSSSSSSLRVTVQELAMRLRVEDGPTLATSPRHLRTVDASDAGGITARVEDGQSIQRHT